MNEHSVKGKWTELKGEVQNLWGKLSGDELEKTKGNVKAIAGLIQQHYGELKDDAKQKFDDLVGRYSSKDDTGEATTDFDNFVGEKGEKQDGLAAKAALKTEEVKDSLKH